MNCLLYSKLKIFKRFVLKEHNNAYYIKNFSNKRKQKNNSAVVVPSLTWVQNPRSLYDIVRWTNIIFFPFDWNAQSEFSAQSFPFFREQDGIVEISANNIFSRLFVLYKFNSFSSILWVLPFSSNFINRDYY